MRISKDGTTLRLIIDHARAYLDPGTPVMLDVPPQIINDRTMIPVRFVTENLGYQVAWDPVFKMVSLYSPFPSRVVELIEQARPAVVLVETNRSYGSGIILSPEGEIVTNAHVVAGASHITITTDHPASFPAVIERIDHTIDLAILKINPGATRLAAWPRYKTSDQLQIDQEVFAFGNPLVPDAPVSRGYIKNLVTENGVTYIQSTIPAAPGSSGSPLITFQGEIAGIITSASTDNTRTCFALPLDYYPGLKNRPPYGRLDEIRAFLFTVEEWEKSNRKISARLDVLLHLYSAGDATSKTKEMAADVQSQINQFRTLVSSYSSSNPQVVTCVDYYAKHLDYLSMALWSMLRDLETGQISQDDFSAFQDQFAASLHYSKLFYDHYELLVEEYYDNLFRS